jgi:hypothetical protein
LKYNKLLNNFWDNNIRYDVTQLIFPFANIDITNGSGMGYWPPFVEKAFAKIHGAYGNAVGGYPDQAMEVL